jgi:hypothetical protein
LTLQQIIETLLRSRLYRTGVAIETDDGELHEGFVQELRYDGSRSMVLVGSKAPGSRADRIPLAHITRVEPRRPPPRQDAA